MSLVFEGIEYNALRATAGRNQTFSNLEFRFKTETGHQPSVKLVLLQTARADTTIAELKREATGLAKTILLEALAVLEAKTVTELIEDQAARDEEAQRHLAALQEPFKPQDD